MRITIGILIISSTYFSLAFPNKIRRKNSGIKLDLRCSQKTCSNEYKIHHESRYEVPSVIDNTKGMLDTYPYETEIIVTRRRKYTSYCYDGGPLDPNTGCSEKTAAVPMTLEEMRRAHEKGECMVGHVCKPDGDCWGSSASKCLSDSLISSKPGSRLSWIGERYFFFPHHTCVMSWECLIYHGPTTTYLQKDEKGATVPGLVLKNQHFIPLDLVNNGKIYVDADGFQYTSGASVPQKLQTRESVKVKCYSSSRDNIDCVYRENEEDIIFKVNPDTFDSVVGNRHLKIIGKVRTIKDGKVVTMKRNHSEPDSKLIFEDYCQGKSTNIDTILEIMHSISVTQMQSVYNTFEMKNDFRRLTDIVIKLTRVASEIDPLFLSKIMNSSLPFKTKWLNDEVFQICKCALDDLSPLETTNCVGDYHHDGIKMQRIDDDSGVCKHVSEINATEIKILDENPLDLSIIKERNVTISTADSTIWQFLHDLRDKESDDPIGLDFASKYSEDGFLRYEDNAWGTLSIFHLSSSLISWVALVVSILSCVRR